MTTEEKQLLLVDLCARLSYGVKVLNTAEGLNKICKLDSIMTARNGKDCFVGLTLPDDSIMTGIEMVKPYLRPISSMTEDEMDRLFDVLQIDKDGKDEDWIKINDVYGIKFFFPTGKWIENVAEAYDYLYSIHIDFRGLIHKGLAIEVTEDNNPYKK